MRALGEGREGVRTMLKGKSGAHMPPDGGDSVWLVRDRVTVKLTSEDTGGVYSMVEEISPPQGGPPPHTHRDEDEVLYVLEGEVEFLLGEDTIPAAGAGSCVYAPIAGCNDIGPPRLVGDRCFFRRATREDRSPRQVCYSKQQGRLVQLQCKAL